MVAVKVAETPALSTPEDGAVSVTTVEEVLTVSPVPMRRSDGAPLAALLLSVRVSRPAIPVVSVRAIG
jgi:hypothetical protein